MWGLWVVGEIREEEEDCGGEHSCCGNGQPV